MEYGMLVRDKVEPFIGKVLELQPEYGWGWSPSYPWANEEWAKDRLPPRSSFNLSGFIESDFGIVGGFGRIDAPQDSKIIGRCFAFVCREVGEHDFDEKICAYNIHFLKEATGEIRDIHRAIESADGAGFGLIGVPGFKPSYMTESGERQE